MKVKCRGYEGELIDLSAITEARRLTGEYKVIAYELRIAIDKGMVTCEPVYDNEIEFIKE